AHLQSLTPLLQCLRVGTATRRADSSGSPSESRAGKGTATQAHRKDVSGARVRMPLKNQKEKIRASPWKICFDFFLLIGGGVTCRSARPPRSSWWFGEGKRRRAPPWTTRHC